MATRVADVAARALGVDDALTQRARRELAEVAYAARLLTK
jgi:hypothetical protein